MFFTWLMQVLADSVFMILRISPSTGTFPKPLSSKEEQLYIKLSAQGDMEARNKLIEHNMRLVAHIVKKYYAAREDYDDMISIGTIGLIKAVCSFNGEKGAKLATYAARCIENEILMYFRSLKKQAVEISLSEPIDNDKDGNALSLIDVISCDDTMLEDLEQAEKQKHMYKYIFSSLDEREREIIILRYGLYGHTPLTQREIADMRNISRSYVSRLEKRALEKLKKEFEG